MKTKWTHNRFKKNDMVKTEFGCGHVIGIDLPESRDAWRWIVMIDDPTKPHSLIEAGEPMCFFDKEIKNL